MGFVQPGWRWISPFPKKPPLLDLKSFLGTSYGITEVLGGRLSWAEVTTPILVPVPHSTLLPFPCLNTTWKTFLISQTLCHYSRKSRVKMDKTQSKTTEELPGVYLCFSTTDLHLEIILNLKAALKIPSPWYSTQHNIIQIKIYFTSYCKQQQEGRAGCGEQLEP